MSAHNLEKALFLDRDGVINVDKNYVYRIEDFEFLPSIFELCAKASALGFSLIVVTNQAGIGRGYYTEADFLRLTEWMHSVFLEKSIIIDRVYYCPYHPTAGAGKYHKDSFDRKPNPGMILRAQHEHGLDLSRSVFIGDKDSDMAAGLSAGVGFLLKLTSEAAPERVDAGKTWAKKRNTNCEVLEVTSLQAATDWFVSTFRKN